MQLRGGTMTTHFIEAEVNLQDTPLKVQAAIEAELKKRGEPLRWAITDVNPDTQTAHVEAIVTVLSERQPSESVSSGVNLD